MRFTHEGQKYELAFSRERRVIKIPQRIIEISPDPANPGDGLVEEVVEWEERPSGHPYTTVNLLQLHDDGRAPTVFRTATVGCWHKDQLSPEKGRLYALRLVSRTLPKDLKKAMWDSYINRPRGAKAQQR